jgi:hypothetical protein
MDKKPRLGSDPLEWIRGGEIMGKKWIIVLLIFVLIVFGFSLRSIADCKSDCQDEYDSGVDSCKTLYDDPDDADTLQICIDNLRSEYQSCVDECED